MTTEKKKSRKKAKRILPLDQNNTRPIKDVRQIQGLLKYVKAMNERDYLIFKLALNTGLRVSDFSRVTVGELREGKIRLQSKKTGKIQSIPVQEVLIKDAKESKLLDSDFVCKSNKGGKLTRGRIHDIISTHGRRYGIKGLAPHSLRKTYGYHHYKTNKDILVLQKIFKHEDFRTTLVYIGVEQEEMDTSILAVSF